MSFALFTELCPACRGPTAAGFCPGCRAEFERIVDPCPICALPRPVAECPRKQAEWRVGRIVAPYAYAYPLSHYLQALKFKHGRRLGRALGLLLGAASAGALRPGTLLVPVPLHGQRLRERGYNQALEIAHAVAAELGAERRAGGIVRGGGGVPQSLLGARARRRNMAGAYRVTGGFEGRHVTLVDDVVTTGATVNALAAALKSAGAARVDALAVARTLPNRRGI
jgi:ComF family protein